MGGGGLTRLDASRVSFRQCELLSGGFEDYIARSINHRESAEVLSLWLVWARWCEHWCGKKIELKSLFSLLAPCRGVSTVRVLFAACFSRSHNPSHEIYSTSPARWENIDFAGPPLIREGCLYRHSAILIDGWPDCRCTNCAMRLTSVHSVGGSPTMFYKNNGRMTRLGVRHA